VKVGRLARRQRLDIPARRWDACLSSLRHDHEPAPGGLLTAARRVGRVRVRLDLVRAF
jgi:hypothetical protein